MIVMIKLKLLLILYLNFLFHVPQTRQERNVLNEQHCKMMKTSYLSSHRSSFCRLPRRVFYCTCTRVEKWIKTREPKKSDKTTEQTEGNWGERCFITWVNTNPIDQDSQRCSDDVGPGLFAFDLHLFGNNYSPLTLSHTLIMKDKQSSACQLPAQMGSRMKSPLLSTELLALRLVSCQRMSSVELTCRVSLDICLPKIVLFPTYEEKREAMKEEEGG